VRPFLLIDPRLCQACAACDAKAVCRMRAVVQLERGDLPVIESSRCRGCMICVPACPHGAVSAPDPRKTPTGNAP